jgi:hypothetical protein
LKVTMPRIGRPHLGTKALGLQAGGDGGGSRVCYAENAAGVG